MIKLKCCLFSFLLVLFFTNSFSQANVSGYEVDLLEKTPQSPNAGGLGKYFDIPVNMATGIPNISIPLYTIKCGNIIVPISLSYHAGGIRVDEIAGCVGLGWSLNAGGSVVKKVNGLDDNYLSIKSGGQLQSYIAPSYSTMNYDMGFTNMNDAIIGLMTNATYASLDSFDRFFSHVAKGYIDAEADEYNYSMPGGSGKLCYNQKQAKFQTKRIDGSIVTGDGNGWTITTNDGKQYEFSQVERTVNPAFLKMLSEERYLTSASHLKNIYDPATGKNVHFAYDNYYKENVPMGFYEVRDYNLNGGQPYLYNTSIDNNLRSGDNLVLSAISFDQGIVYFIKETTTRPDHGPNAIKEIQVFNTDNLLVKKFNLEYFYSSNRLFLKSLQEIQYENGNTLTHPAYKFTYDTAIHLPARLSYAQDKWGYYNGKTSNWTSIPSHPLASQYPILTLADRRVDSNYAKAGMLNGIVHPTGGKTVFEFECNRIITDTLIGGQRIRKITHFDSVAQKSIISEYKYLTQSGFSSGGIESTPVFNYDLYRISGTPQIFYVNNIMRTESNSINSLFPNQGSPVYYQRVEKREKSANNDLLSVHYFQNYYEVGEIYTNARRVPHKKELEINDIQETSSEIYKKEENNNYTLIQKKSSVFDVIASTQNAIWNTQAAWQMGGFEFSEWPGGDPVTIIPMAGFISPTLNAYKKMPCANVKIEQYESNYANGNTLTVPSYFEYDSTNGNVKVSKTVDSKGDTIIRTMKYACDYIAAVSPSINNEIKSLIDQNMKGAPIEIITMLKKKNATTSTVQSAELYEYVDLKIKKVYRVYDQIPLASFTISYNDVNGFYKDSHYQLEQEITAWDAEGRPRTVVSKSNKTSYIWDEKYDQPTAIVANASYEDVAYTGFEGQSNGSWTVNSTNREINYFVTGKQCYQLSNGSISKSGLTSSQNHILSYWSRNGSNSSFTVSGSTSVIEGRTINGWTYYEHIINGTSVTVSGSGYIDELRIYPKGSLMSSNAYEPLRGITSQCDANNRISYYIYDAFSRLVLIRDQENNILKKICYNYAGQPENCATNCTNFIPDWQNTTAALRCQYGTCGNTGYQEQQQRDMNPCSPSFDSTRWINAGYDSTACPLGSCVNLTSTNVIGISGYTASYLNTDTDITYNFSVPATTGLQPLGIVPAGNYTLTISRTTGAPMNGIFKSGCWKQTMTGSSATFYNVGVSTTTCNSITVDISGIE